MIQHWQRISWKNYTLINDFYDRHCSRTALESIRRLKQDEAVGIFAIPLFTG